MLDTPGHVDFSAEMERTLQVLDYAILVINGADGVQGHTMTLWRLLARYQIPTFLFINKMDQDGTDKEKLLAELKKRLSDNCVDFTWEKSDLQSQFLEDVSVCDEELLEKYLETEEISTSDIRKVIKERKLFPCFFGSALKMTGVEEFLHGLEKYCETPDISFRVWCKSIQDCQRRSGQSFKLYENHRRNIEGKGTSHRYRESGSDPYLFRCEI